MSQSEDSSDSAPDMAHLVSEFIFWFATVLFALRGGRRWWLFFQGITTIGMALLGLIAPYFTYNTIVKSLVGDYDDCHSFAIRVFSLFYVICGLMIFFCRNSTDDRAVSALTEGLCVAYTLESISHVIFGARPHVENPVHYSEKAMPFIVAFMLGNYIHLVVGQTCFNDFRNQSSNLNARFDAVCLIIVGGSVYAFTEDILIFMTKKTDFDTGHVGAMTVAGAYILCSSVISLHAEEFTREIRRMMYLGRIFESACVTALVFSHLLFSDTLTANSLWAVLTYGLLAGNALVAMWRMPNKIKD